jgi:predicted RNA-binding protein with PUA-like domain
MQYWLVKSEPDDFSIDDLKRVKTEPWTGVRNYQARNYMRDSMDIGDEVLFYHSNTTPLGIVGRARVGSHTYPDPTQFDASSDYFEPRATPEKPIWMLVDLSFIEKFPRLLSLGEIKQDPLLRAMRVAHPGMRLSVQPVEEVHFHRVCELCRS